MHMCATCSMHLCAAATLTLVSDPAPNLAHAEIPYCSVWDAFCARYSACIASKWWGEQQSSASSVPGNAASWLYAHTWSLLSYFSLSSSISLSASSSSCRLISSNSRSSSAFSVCEQTQEVRDRRCESL
jgi:hypothetical protein